MILLHSNNVPKKITWLKMLPQDNRLVQQSTIKSEPPWLL